MRKAVNKDSSPRKPRIDCRVNLLPDEGKVEFAEIIQRNPSSPNVEQLEAVCHRHGVKWSRTNIYEFIKSPRALELTITAGVIRNRLLGATLAAAGADALHADARRLATGYWMTVARAAQELDTPKRKDETSEEFETRRSRATGEMDQATRNLTSLGLLKSGEDKGAIALAKLELEREKVRQGAQKLATVTCTMFLKWFKDAKAREIAEGQGTNAEKIAALRKTYFHDIDALEDSGEVQLPK